MSAIDMTPVSYFVIGIVVYYLLLFAVSLRQRRRPTAVQAPSRPVVVMVVPARDEELVIEATLANLINESDYECVRVLVMDDASSDRTAEIVSQFATSDPRVRLVTRSRPHARMGKSAVLNHAFTLIDQWQRDGDPFVQGSDLLLGVVDADGCLDCDAISRVIPYFADPEVGQVQIGVSIANARDGILERLQDIEFVGFSGLVQVARDHVGSPGLGGNGQFARLEALRSLGADPWNATSLTEDLELGLRLVLAGWHTRFCSGVFVHQQGLDRWAPLLRQRTRWIQGHYQCWRYIPRLLRARGAGIIGRVDLMLYLMLVVTIVAVFCSGAVSLLLLVAGVPVTDSSLSFVHNDVVLRLVTFVLCVGPLLSTMSVYQRLSPQRLRIWELPAYCLMFTVYSYVVWLTATIRAWLRMATRRRSWTKTPRVEGATMGVPSPAEVS